ncbi:HD-GYP domain-containing protein [Pleionea mediterranea]|uniref:HD domain-containing protein n=1 Tax=Pleionea mediterranea TaxID=523701 RepID=A0A316FGG2_9GAMM|nr:HD domain-containing phosphohydrolase [Pleionea mediterranea]PWK46806.1 HD domain-containing protein [Pleionea mediterranea]
MEEVKEEHYIGHLKDINTQQPVLASEDIYNENGVLLVAKGTPLSASASQKLLSHKLAKPLDEVVALEHRLTELKLFHSIQQCIKQYPDLYYIHQSFQFDGTLKNLFTTHDLPRTLLQKLTVLQEKFPQVYQCTLFTCWFSSLMVSEMKLPRQQAESIFLASLFSDLGLLHIAEELVEKDSFDDAVEQRNYQSHPLIARMIADNCSLYSNDMLEAIAQHHERRDGHGYPKKLYGEQLTFEGQLLAMVNHLYHVRMKVFVKKHHTLMEFAPYLLINLRSFPAELIRAMHQLLRRSGLPLHHNIELGQLVSASQQLTISIKAIRQVQASLVELAHLLEPLQTITSAKRLLRSALSLNSTIVRSGLTSEDIENWLGGLKESDYQDSVQDVAELQHLEYWLYQGIDRIKQQLSKMSEQDKVNDSTKQSLTGLAEQIQQQLAVIYI